MDEITELIIHANRKLHECHTKHPDTRLILTCDPDNCRSGKYLPGCLRCYRVETQCQTCKAVITFPTLWEDGLKERGDHFIRTGTVCQEGRWSVDNWMCPTCGAMELGVDERRDKMVQTTLEGF